MKIKKLIELKNRKQLLELLMALIMLVLVYIFAGRIPALKASAVASDVEKEHIILIDAGHGGNDPGAISVLNAVEKDINLSIALKLKENLESSGYKVLMTRETDMGLYDETDKNKKVSDMKKRCALANDNEVDLVISIHQNKYQSEGVKGAQVFYYKSSTDSQKLAEYIQHELVESLDKSNGRKAKANGNYYMLLNVKCPAVIVECGFLSNYAEAKLLVEDEYQEKIATAIETAINKYFE